MRYYDSVIDVLLLSFFCGLCFVHRFRWLVAPRFVVFPLPLGSEASFAASTDSETPSKECVLGVLILGDFARPREDKLRRRTKSRVHKRVSFAS